jgi:hypothetical protein
MEEDEAKQVLVLCLRQSHRQDGDDVLAFPGAQLLGIPECRTTGRRREDEPICRRSTDGDGRIDRRRERCALEGGAGHQCRLRIVQGGEVGQGPSAPAKGHGPSRGVLRSWCGRVEAGALVDCHGNLVVSGCAQHADRRLVGGQQTG